MPQATRHLLGEGRGESLYLFGTNRPPWPHARAREIRGGGPSVRGRKPKPTAVKRLTGNPGKRKINRAEPRPKPDLLDAPAWLDATAREEWRRVVPELRGLGIFTVLDRTTLASYCLAYSRWRRAEARLNSAAEMVSETDSGYEQKSPWTSISKQYADQMKALASELGFSPAARTRLVGESGGSGDPDDEFFKKPGGDGRAQKPEPSGAQYDA